MRKLRGQYECGEKSLEDIGYWVSFKGFEKFLKEKHGLNDTSNQSQSAYLELMTQIVQLLDQGKFPGIMLTN